MCAANGIARRRSAIWRWCFKTSRTTIIDSRQRVAMAHVPDPVGAGYFARQQIYSRDPLIAWSHRRRFRTALVLARPFTGGRVLDYGCGDGTFVGLLQTSGAPPAVAVGAEIDPRVVADCRHRFASLSGVRFMDVAALDR